MIASRWAVIICIAALSACSFKTGYNFDREANFSKYKTYKWVDVKGGTDKLNDIERRQVEAALERSLAAEGFTKTDSDTADIYAGYQVGFQADQQYTTFNSGGPWGYGGGWGPGWGYGWGGGGISQTTSQTILTGTLVLDMYDREAKKLVWRGQVAGTVDPSRAQDQRLKRLDQAVQDMMKNYPPKVAG